MDEEQFILFLRGVSLKDVADIDELFESKLTDSLQTSYKKVIYDKIPKVFKSLESWVTTTNIKCWHCELSFSNPPVFIPLEIYNTTIGKEMSVYGNFCSFGCAKAFLNYRRDITEDKYWDANEMLKILFNIFNKKKINDIIPSPDKYDINKYGCKLCIKEYQTLLTNIYNKNMR